MSTIRPHPFSSLSIYFAFVLKETRCNSLEVLEWTELVGGLG